MSARLPLFVAAVFVASAAGCCPSTANLKTMRTEMETQKMTAQAAKDKDAALFGFMVKPRDPVWEAEAETTLVEMDDFLKCAESDPASRAKLEELLESEYQSPRTVPKTTSGDENYRLRAWSVYSLGKMNAPESLEFLVSAVESNSNSTDDDFQIRAAALNSLSAQTDALSKNGALRNRALYQVPVLTAELRAAAAGPRTEWMQECLKLLELRLKSYPVVVELLPQPNDKNFREAQVLAVIEWDYTKLTAGEQLGAGNEEVLETNILKLLALSWDKDLAIRTAARSTLAKFAPLRLFSEAIQRIQVNRCLLAEDCELLANLLPLTDKLGGNSPPYRQQVETASDLTFMHIAALGTGSREVIYARLLANEPVILAQHLKSPAVNAQIFAEDSLDALLQHVRYLGHLRANEIVRKDPALSRDLARTMVVFMQKKPLEVRRQIVAHLLNEDPGILSASYTPVLKGLGSETPEAAAWLLDSYMTSMERMEARTLGKMDAGKETIESFGGHPYDFLAHGLARPEIELRKKVTRWLIKRDATRLVALLSADVTARVNRKEALDPQEFAMLGDTMQAEKANIQPAAAEAGIRAIRLGLASADEPTNLICCRYLVELGAPITDAEKNMLCPPARLLLNAATARKPQGETHATN